MVIAFLVFEVSFTPDKVKENRFFLEFVLADKKALIAEAIDLMKRKYGISTAHGSDQMLADKIGKKKQVIANWRRREGIPVAVLRAELQPKDFNRVVQELITLESKGSKEAEINDSLEPGRSDLTRVEMAIKKVISVEMWENLQIRKALVEFGLEELAELRSEGRENDFERRAGKFVALLKSAMNQQSP